MAVNFCSRDYGTIVTTNSVSVDGYEVENLLGRKTMWGQPKGFMSESFVKPPVDVTFMLPFNVWLQKIVINPKVGSQVSTGFEVFTASVAMPRTPRSSGAPSQRGKSGQASCPDTKPTLRTQSQMLAEKDSAVFASISKAFAVDGNTATFCFINHSYQPMFPQIARDLRREEVESATVTRALRYAQPGVLTNVSHVTVRVIRAPCGSVAIKNVQILGQPAWSCPRPTINWFLQVIKAIQNPQHKEEKSGATLQTTNKSQLNGGCSSGSSVNKSAASRKNSADTPTATDLIPEEFIDPITRDMLVLPVLLPSGHTVDSDTLRKHSEAEELWGRPPNDPFTGIPFTKGSRPLPNIKLKERLDLYLLKGGPNVVAPPARDVGRSRGRPTNQGIPAPASLVNRQSDSTTLNDALKKVQKIPETTGPSSSHRSASQPVSTIRPRGVSKRHLSGVSLDSALPVKRKPPTTLQRCRNEPKDRTSHLSRSSAAVPSTSSHEQMLSESLDSALESALSSLPSFSKPTIQQPDRPTDDAARSWSCQSCHKVLAAKDGLYHVNGPLNMYKLPCTHLICRECLLPGSSGASRMCAVCSRTFEPSEVVKVHV